VAELADMTLAAFVVAMGEDRPAPGAGSAAGAALAMGAACAAKAFRISARHTGDEALALAAGRAEALALAALADGQRDIEDFTALLHAPHGDPIPARALHADGEALLATAADLRALVEAHRRAVVETMAGDIVAALALAQAAERVQRRNLAELG
jgi:hypothetical protein